MGEFLEPLSEGNLGPEGLGKTVTQGSGRKLTKNFEKFSSLGNSDELILVLSRSRKCLQP